MPSYDTVGMTPYYQATGDAPEAIPMTVTSVTSYFYEKLAAKDEEIAQLKALIVKFANSLEGWHSNGAPADEMILLQRAREAVK